MKIGDLCPERSKRSACGDSAPFGQAPVVNEEGWTGSPTRQEHPRGRYAACAQSAMLVDLVSAKNKFMSEIRIYWSRS
jgi:hypothetical protein